MKKIRSKIYSIILESFEKVSYHPFDSDQIEDEGFDPYEVAEQAGKIAKNAGMNILSDMELFGVLLHGGTCVGGLWITSNNEFFSFDIAIDPKYRSMGLSHVLIKNAISEFEERSYAHEEVSSGDLMMRVDVINPVLAKTLLKYGFHVIQTISKDRVIMGR